MSLTFKLLSLVIRTAAKPFGNYIKRQAKEHDGFRRFAVAQAQRVHRIDMRMRLGILHDPVAQERMHDREQKAAEEKKRKAETPTVRTADEQRQHDEEQAKAEANPKGKEEKPLKLKIRPLSEAKAIELGANFFSEAFIFAVAAGLLVWDSWRSRRKESNRRDMVSERLESLETEIERLRGKYEPELATVRESTTSAGSTSKWYNPASWWTKTDPETDAVGASSIAGNVPGPADVKPSSSQDASRIVSTVASSAPAHGTAVPVTSPKQTNAPKEHIDAVNGRTKSS